MGLQAQEETMAYRYGGYGYPAYAAPVPTPAPGSFHGSLRLSDELKQEEDFLGARRQLYGDLRTAEAAEQSRRAATAEQIHARAMEEYRLRDAEAKAAAAAKALYERAAEAARRAEEA